VGELPPPASPADATGSPPRETGRIGYRRLLSDVAFRRLWVLVALLYAAGYGQFGSIFPAYLTRDGGVGARTVALAFAVNTITVVAVQLLTARIVGGRRRTRAIAVLCAIWAGAWVLLAYGGPAGGAISVAAALAVAAVFGVGETILAPTVPAMVNDLSPETMRGRYNGGATMAYTAGFLLGPAVGGFALARLGATWFMVLAAVCGAGMLLTLRLERALPQSANRRPSRRVAAPDDGVPSTRGLP
jgi:MFS family permease